MNVPVDNTTRCLCVKHPLVTYPLPTSCYTQSQISLCDVPAKPYKIYKHYLILHFTTYEYGIFSSISRLLRLKKMNL